MWKVEKLDCLGDQLQLYCIKGENNESVVSLLEYENARDIVASHNFMLAVNSGNTPKTTSSILKRKT